MSQSDHNSRLPPPERAFIGLESFVESDAGWFTGRQEEIARIRTLVQDYPFVLLNGYTGVGKTSLIRAGILPRWRADGWHCVYLSFGDFALGPTGSQTADGAPPDLRELLDHLVGEAAPLGATFTSALERLAQRHPDTTALVALDGFERLVQGADAALVDGMYRALTELVTGHWPNLRLLIAYRGDAEPDVGPPLQGVVGLAGGPPRVYLLPLPRTAAAEILSAGFQAAGVTLADEQLLGTILDELEHAVTAGNPATVGNPATAGHAGHAGAAIFPSHLQMLGHSLCQAAADYDRQLTGALYEELGGAPAILDDYLTRQLGRFGERRGEAEKVLVGLVRHGRQSERQLRETTGLKAELAPDDWSQLLADLATVRLIRLSEDPGGVTQVQVVHELLAGMIQRETVRQERELRRLRGALALRAAAMEQGPVVLRADVMAELYTWRERIVPSPTELRLLLYNGLLERGPAWYWLRRVPVVGIRRFLTQAREIPFPELQRAAGLALAAAATVEDALTLQRLQSDDDPHVRAAAARALVTVIPDLGWDDALMLRYLVEAPDGEVRRAAAEALASVFAKVGRDILPYVPEMLREDDTEVRYIAGQVLSHVATREDLPLLRRWLQDEDLNVLNAAWDVLTQVLARTPTEDLDELLALATDDDPYVQGAAREVLTQVAAAAGPEDEPLLLQLSQSDDPNVRRAATLALVRLLREDGAAGAPIASPPERLQRLRPLLDDWDAAVRHAAGRALAEALAQVAQDEGAALAELRAHMESPDRPVRLAFAQALTQRLGRRGRESIPELRQLLDDLDPDVRRAAREALEEVLAQVGREAIPDLQAMLEDPNWDVWQVAGLALARVLSELGRPGLRDLRLLVKEGEDPEVRRAGGRALAGVLRDLGRVSLPELQHMLEDEDLLLARAAAQALAQVLEDSGARGVPELGRLLRNEDPEIHAAARQALIGIAARMNQDLLPLLRDLLTDDHQAVREAAQAALDRVVEQQGRRLIPYLRETLHDRHPFPRHAAAATLSALDPVSGLQAWSELVMAYPLDNEYATRALVALDRQSYCPFAEAWQSRVVGE